MKHLPLLAIAAWFPVAAALGAQRPPQWRVEMPGRVSTVGAVGAAESEALPASVLVAR